MQSSVSDVPVGAEPGPSGDQPGPSGDQPAHLAACRSLLDELGSLIRLSRARYGAAASAAQLQPALVQLLGIADRLGEARPGLFAENHHVDPSVVSRQLAALEALGLLCRRPDPDDGRASLVSITPAGRGRLGRARAHHASSFAEHLADWDRSRVEALAAELHAVTTAIGRVEMTQ